MFILLATPANHCYTPSALFLYVIKKNNSVQLLKQTKLMNTRLKIIINLNKKNKTHHSIPVNKNKVPDNSTKARC